MCMCLFCVSECPDHFWFWQKNKYGTKLGPTPDPLPPFFEHVPSSFLKFDSLPRFFSMIIMQENEMKTNREKYDKKLRMHKKI